MRGSRPRRSRAGANDYLVKFPDRAELVARIRHHSKGFIHMLERDAAHAALARELADAASYAHSLLPRPLRGQIRTNWTLVSCQGLGGDSLGYHWLDDHHFAIYSLDVSGRGVGAALHSARVVQAVRHHGLHEATDFLDPGSVLWAAERCVSDGTPPRHVRLRLVRRVRHA